MSDDGPVAGDGGGPEPDVGPSRRSWLPLLLPLLALSLAALAAVVIRLPYYAIAPGDAQPVNDLIKVPDDRAFPPSGRVSATTVSLRSVTPFTAVLGWLDGDVDVVPEPDVLGAPSSRRVRQEFSREAEREMTQAKDVAVLVALRRAGFQVPELGAGAQVTSVVTGSPAEGRLGVGDAITAVNGRATALAKDVVDAIVSHGPGQSVVLDVVGADGSRRAEEVVLARHPSRPTGFLGASLVTREHRFDYPFDVEVDSLDAGGASAGLAFALGVVDALTRGELTGGHHVAATGTIAPDGRVGEVDGVAQKAAAARRAGVDYFLVPPGAVAGARAHAGERVEVLGVSSLDEAIAALGRLGGDVSGLLGPGAERAALAQGAQPGGGLLEDPRS